MKKNTMKRIVALAAVVLLAGLYVVTLVVACLDIPGSGNLFRACLVATVAVPLLAWIFIWLYGQMTGKRTIADLNLMQSPEDVRKAAEEEKEAAQAEEEDTI